MSRPLWVSTADIPAMFGISTKSVSNAINAGAQIRRRYLGNKPLYSVADIDAWINAMPADKDGGLS